MNGATSQGPLSNATSKCIEREHFAHDQPLAKLYASNNESIRVLSLTDGQWTTTTDRIKCVGIWCQSHTMVCQFTWAGYRAMWSFRVNNLWLPRSNANLYLSFTIFFFGSLTFSATVILYVQLKIFPNQISIYLEPRGGWRTTSAHTIHSTYLVLTEKQYCYWFGKYSCVFGLEPMHPSLRRGTFVHSLTNANVTINFFQESLSGIDRSNIEQHLSCLGVESTPVISCVKYSYPLPTMNPITFGNGNSN